MKPKLFINSTDVAEITGYTQRNARNIMAWLRTEKNLPPRHAISIYDFCDCFNLPLDVVFRYVNSKDFKLLPIDEDSLRRSYTPFLISNQSKTMPLIYSKDFEPLVSKPRALKQDNITLNDFTEEAG